MPNTASRTGCNNFPGATLLGISLKHLQEGKEKRSWCKGLEKLVHGFSARGDVACRGIPDPHSGAAKAS